jgi:leucyl aminopeptidase (aminopeptidase T)
MLYHYNHLKAKIDKKQASLIHLLEKVQRVFDFTAENTQNDWHRFFNKLSTMVLETVDMGRIITPEYFYKKDFEKLLQINHNIHRERLPENYDSSYANPTYAVKCFGSKFGTINASVFSQIMNIQKCAYQSDTLKMHQLTELLVKYFKVWKSSSQNYEKMLKIVRDNDMRSMYDLYYQYYVKRFVPQFDFFTNWIKTTDLNDLRYLFYFGEYISQDTIQMACFINSLPQQKIDSVMNVTAKGFIDGFLEGNKDYKKKKTVFLEIPLGMERFARSLIRELESKYNFTACISRIRHGKTDQQYQYDHRFDDALYLDEAYASRQIKMQTKAIKDSSKYILNCGGGIYFDSFGDKPFSPKTKSEALKYSERQTELSQKVKVSISSVFNKYYRRDENSFCIIAFPTPAIGEKFPEIFEKTIDINLLKHDLWLKIQQYLIDALDKADVVKVKGFKKNKTDIIVKMQKLNNPRTETNYFNCGATVNIPVGEVFTTPQLYGTHGKIHIAETYLNDLLYKDLELTFVDGRITEYSCKNFPDEAANQNYIRENLLFPFKSLPLGEFAIGTNTLAYQMARKYDILSVLPVLIIEKMGPHFAIGDTCYNWEEDTPVFNPDNKEVISRDNEQSILRKKNINDAYLCVHTDITLPFDEIGLIQAISESGEKIDIISKGKFVLPGTLELNEYLK